ncbi:hypothetical protein ACFO4O_05985 [Glaciecola siphonariae]|uniref:DUF5362 domain-containing protein n=1 Tax=Glaciecola siphonariae TaxID=521012 RepID=A0ABV9LT72_9ALTE
MYEATEAQAPQNNQFDELITPLSNTKFWVKLCAILGFIGSGFMLLFGLLILIGMGGMASFFGQENNGLAGGFGIFVGIMYIVLAAIFFLPPLFLFRYGKSISKAESSKNYVDIVDALTHQKSFWKFIGIIVVIYLVIFILSIALAIILPAINSL